MLLKLELKNTLDFIAAFAVWQIAVIVNAAHSVLKSDCYVGMNKYYQAGNIRVKSMLIVVYFIYYVLW